MGLGLSTSSQKIQRNRETSYSWNHAGETSKIQDNILDSPTMKLQGNREGGKLVRVDWLPPNPVSKS